MRDGRWDHRLHSFVRIVALRFIRPSLGGIHAANAATEDPSMGTRMTTAHPSRSSGTGNPPIPIAFQITCASNAIPHPRAHSRLVAFANLETARIAKKKAAPETLSSNANEGASGTAANVADHPASNAATPRVPARQVLAAKFLMDVSRATRCSLHRLKVPAPVEHQVLPRRRRLAEEQFDRRAFRHSVGSDHAARERRHLEQPQRLAGQTILNLSLRVQRRSRVKVRAVVRPSPEEPAMVQAVYPSPSTPRPAVEGPFLTKRLVFTARAMSCSRSMFLEWITAVWK